MTFTRRNVKRNGSMQNAEYKVKNANSKVKNAKTGKFDFSGCGTTFFSLQNRSFHRLGGCSSRLGTYYTPRCGKMLETRG